MNSVARLLKNCCAFNFDRGSRVNKQREMQQQRRQRKHRFRSQNFEIYDDESERQLQQDQRSAEKKAFFGMADIKGESAVLSDSDDGESVTASPPVPQEQLQGARNPMEALKA